MRLPPELNRLDSLLAPLCLDNYQRNVQAVYLLSIKLVLALRLVGLPPTAFLIAPKSDQGTAEITLKLDGDIYFLRRYPQ